MQKPMIWILCFPGAQACLIAVMFPLKQLKPSLKFAEKIRGLYIMPLLDFVSVFGVSKMILARSLL